MPPRDERANKVVVGVVRLCLSKLRSRPLTLKLSVHRLQSDLGDAARQAGHQRRKS
jgi:hypothetical protein